MFIIRLLLHVTVQKQQVVHTVGGNFILLLQNMLFLFPFPISSPKLLPFRWESHGNPVRMGIPIPTHTSTARTYYTPSCAVAINHIRVDPRHCSGIQHCVAERSKAIEQTYGIT